MCLRLKKTNALLCNTTDHMLFQQKEIQRQHKIIEDLEDIITKARRVRLICSMSSSLFSVPARSELRYSGLQKYSPPLADFLFGCPTTWS